MECMFYKLEKKNCFFQQRCEGIYQLMLEFGQDSTFAKEFSRYCWRRSILNKLEDKRSDPVQSFESHLNKIFAKITYPLFRIWNRDIFWIDHYIKKFEDQVKNLEITKKYKEPMDYFYTVGKGYAVFFKYAAIYAKAEKAIIPVIETLGYHIGTLVSLRDSFLDFDRDKRNHAFNPFIGWNRSKIRQYYHQNKEILINEIRSIKNNLEERRQMLLGLSNNLSSKSLTSIDNYLTRINTCIYKCQTSINKVNASVKKIPPWAKVLSAIFCLIPSIMTFGAAQPVALAQVSSDCCCCYWLEALNCECTCCEDACQGCCDNACDSCCDGCECNSCQCSGCDCNCG